MPKMKSHRGASKRFTYHKSGIVKRNSAYKSHRLNSKLKSRKRKRNLRKGGYPTPTLAKKMCKIIVK